MKCLVFHPDGVCPDERDCEACNAEKNNAEEKQKHIDTCPISKKYRGATNVPFACICSPAPSHDGWEEIEVARKEWETQGRTDEQKYGVVNFLTGLGGVAIRKVERAAEERGKEWGLEAHLETCERKSFDFLKEMENARKSERARVKAEIREKLEKEISKANRVQIERLDDELLGLRKALTLLTRLDEHKEK